MGPFSDIPNHECTPSSAGTSPRPGLIPKTPHAADGIRIDPIPSAASAIGTIASATAAAEPPDDPPGTSAGFQGLRVIRPGESTAPHTHSSGTAVSPTGIAPAARSRATVG